MDSGRILIVVLMGLSMIGNNYVGVSTRRRYRTMRPSDDAVSSLRIRSILTLAAAAFAAIVIVVEVFFA